MLLDGEAWADKFKTFQTEAWRLETLPQYVVPQEAEEFAAFKAGARFPGPYEDAWTAMVRTRNVGRVHIVNRPLTDYLRFEFERYYQHQAPAGEDIRILDITDRPNPAPRRPGLLDVRPLDGRPHEVRGRRYADRAGAVRGRPPAPFLEYRRIAIAESVAFLEYVTE